MVSMTGNREAIATVGADHRQTVGTVGGVVNRYQGVTAIGREVDRVILAIGIGGGDRVL